MATLEITNNATDGIVVWDPTFQDETLNAAGAVTWAAGTLLGRITASGKLTAYTVGATGGAGSGVAVAVLRDAVVFTGAGDQRARPIIRGTLRRGDLVAHGVGAITVPESEQLRDFGIVSLTTTQLAQLDNQ
jgi:hypothetical protein